MNQAEMQQKQPATTCNIKLQSPCNIFTTTQNDLNHMQKEYQNLTQQSHSFTLNHDNHVNLSPK